MFKRAWARWILKGLAAAVILAVLGVGVLLGALRLEHGTETTLPAPTGPFAVGRAIDVWTDRAPDTLAPIAATPRELLVWIWYPSATGSVAQPDDYLPAPVRAGIERVRGGLISGLLTRDLSRVHGHSTRAADVSPEQRSYPVVIMRAGASAEVGNYSTLVEDLASHGYVVVGFDAPYRTGVVVFPDGRVVTRREENNPEVCLGQPAAQQAACANRLQAAWTADIAFVLDRLARLNASDPAGRWTGRLDMTRIGVFGHSFGGAAAAQFCHDDARCMAGIDVDGAPLGSVIQTGLKQPFMFLLSDHGDTSDPDSRQILANIQSIYDRQPPDRRLRVVIRGANHFLFSDDGALLKSALVRRTMRGLGVLGIDGPRQLAITAYCVRSFFDAHLKGDGRLDLASPLYPEIEIVK